MKTNENFQLSTFNIQPNKRLAVVILNWNGRALMEEFLPSVVAYTPGEWAGCNRCRQRLYGRFHRDAEDKVSDGRHHPVG